MNGTYPLLAMAWPGVCEFTVHPVLDAYEQRTNERVYNMVYGSDTRSSQ